jgi:hypothetical protein
LLKLLCARVFQSIHFFLLWWAAHFGLSWESRDCCAETSLPFTEKFVCFPCLNLSEIYGFFWIQRREEERVWLSSCNVVAN